MENTVWSLLPPLLAIVMVLLTKRVLVSLAFGIIAASFLLAQFSIFETFALIWEAFSGVFVDGGALNTWNVFILSFVLMLGVITAFISMMGGARAFGEWMIKRVKSRAGAQIMTAILGIVIFIDDYFNSLTVGQVAKPITDQHRISRAKLSYIIDSTAAPVCVVAPISSWGAYIIGVLGSILVAQGITDFSAFSAFLQIIPMNLYVWAALGLVFVIAIKNADFGPMSVHEKRALQTGQVTDPSHKEVVDAEDKLPISQNGKVRDLFLPLILLFAATIAAIIFTGVRATTVNMTLINIFGNADVPLSLLVGGITGLLFTFILYFRQHSKDQLGSGASILLGVKEGLRSMLPSVGILIMAWMIVSLIDQLGTGTFLAEIVKGANISSSLLPAILFVFAGVIAFSTGTSWGSFGLLLPIAGQIAASTDINLILPMLAAVLAGAVMGDHCSPISDTTILSSTGANCHHMDHVTTQIPYALTAAGISLIGYIILGLTSSVWLGLGTVFLGLVVVYVLLKPDSQSMTTNQDKEAIAK